jgi:hypothetical protein
MLTERLAMMKFYKYLPSAAMVMALTACASSAFVSSWKDPGATPLQLRGSKVAAVVMMNNDESRRIAEDSLAREITARGALGVAMYTLMPGKPADEAAAKEVLEQAGVAGAVVMRPVAVDKEVASTSALYTDPMHRGFWGGYYGHGWGSAWGPTTTESGELATDTIVVVETLVYSLKQNKLVWAGQSKTTNPKNVDELIHNLARDAAKELEKQGLISTPSS